MKIFIWFYFVLLVISLIGSVYLASPNITPALMISTFGLAYRITLFPTVPYYLLALLPGVLVCYKTERLLFGTIVATTCVAIAAFAPVIPSNIKLKELEASLKSAKTVESYHTPLRTMEIVTTENARSYYEAKSHIEDFISYSYNNKPFPEERCDRICQKLLRSHQVDWIRLKIIGSTSRDGTKFFTLGRGKSECGFSDSKTQEDQCILITRDAGDLADLKIEIRNKVGDGQSIFENETSDEFRGWVRLLAWDYTTGKPKLSYSNAQQKYWSKVSPIMFTTFNNDMNIEIYRKERILNPIDYADMLTELGYDILDVFPAKGEKFPAFPQSLKTVDAREPSEGQTKEVLSILDIPKSSTWSKSQVKSVNDWLWYAKNFRKWTPDRLEVLKRIFQDPRMANVGFFGNLAKSKDAASIILPLALDQVIQFGEIDQKVADVLRHILTINTDVLLQSQTSVIQILNSNKGGKFTDKLIAVAAFSGTDPDQYLDQINSHTAIERIDKERTVIRAYCYLQPAGNPKSLGMLRKFLKIPESIDHGKVPDAKTSQVLRALASHGDMDTVSSAVNNSTWTSKPEKINALQELASTRQDRIHNVCNRY